MKDSAQNFTAMLDRAEPRIQHLKRPFWGKLCKAVHTQNQQPLENSRPAWLFEAKPSTKSIL